LGAPWRLPRRWLRVKRLFVLCIGFRRARARTRNAPARPIGQMSRRRIFLSALKMAFDASRFKQSITSTSTVRRGGLSTSTANSQNQAMHRSGRSGIELQTSCSSSNRGNRDGISFRLSMTWVHSSDFLAVGCGLNDCSCFASDFVVLVLVLVLERRLRDRSGKCPDDEYSQVL
jgi:hypothetical protein